MLRVIARPTTPTVSVVNDVSLELYLRGVVPVEMPSTWPAAALQAQAIAARSYAARRSSGPASRTSTSATTRARRSTAARSASERRPNAAIAATAGQVLLSGASIANALFHSTGGGATENNENVFTSADRRARSAGRSATCAARATGAPDGTAYDAAAPYATWATADLHAQPAVGLVRRRQPRTDVGDLSALDLRDRGVSGRLVSVTLIGSAGSEDACRATVFRAIFNAAPAGRPTRCSGARCSTLAPIP